MLERLNADSGASLRRARALTRGVCWTLGLLIGGLSLTAPARADWNTEYQFGTQMPAPPNDPVLWTNTTAFLWVPPQTHHIRAVVLAPANIIERRFCDDPIIRAEAARDGIALVFFQAGWKKEIFDTPRLTEVVQTVLDRLAAVSGYDELRTAPWIPFGHSGNSAFCAAIARQNPQRILANIVVKGVLPNPAKDGSTAGLVGIPILFVTGQFEEVMPPGGVRDAWWGVQMKRFSDAKAAVPDALINGMEDRSHGHLTWFPEMSRYAALFLHKAVTARLAPDGSLVAVPFASGWLTDPTGVHPPAPVAQYKGDPRQAFWNFDQEQARAWQPLFAIDRGKKEQMLAFVQDGQTAPWWNGWAVQVIKFEPLADGESFTTDAVFRDEIPTPFADAAVKLGHSARGPIEYTVLGWAGATEQTGPNTFRVRFDREGVNGRTLHVVIGALHHGDAEYRETIAAASMDLPGSNPGTKQTITFPPITDVKAGTASVPLGATVDSGLKPDYYVSWGPAVIDGDRLRFTPLPARAQYPIEVRVTAYQWGKATAPQFATATPVTQTFNIVR